MRILLTGANGYVGRRLLPELLANGHEVICCVRDKNRLGIDEETLKLIHIWEVDFLLEPNLDNLAQNIDVVYSICELLEELLPDNPNAISRSNKDGYS